jgi:hypothetical protein
MPDVTTTLHPTSTTNSLNFFSNPNVGADLHLNVDETDLSCVDDGTYGTDRIGTNDNNGRVKLRFTPPALAAGETFFGIRCTACVAMSTSTPLVDSQEVKAQFHGGIYVGAELFLESIPIAALLSVFTLAEGPPPVHTVGGWPFFQPNIVGRLAFHEAILTAGLNPDTVNWNTLEVQFSPEDLISGDTLSFEWIIAQIDQGFIDPVISGGLLGGGNAEVESTVFIGGGGLLGGEAIVRPIVEIGSGGIIVSPSVHATSTETRTPIGGATIPPTTVFVDFVKHFENILPDTKCFLSGGSSNGDPLLSLGGDVSITEAGGDLFDDFQPEESSTGLEDYRCIYIFNGLTDPINGVEVWLESPPLSSAAVLLGVDEADDMQEINLSFFSGIGTFTLDFDGRDIVVSADSDLGIFAQNFQDSLRDDEDLTDVIVQAKLIDTTVNFTVIFTGLDGRRKQPVFGLKNNSLGGSPAISINQTSIGSPINATAETIDNDIKAPLNPEFRETTRALPIIIPHLAVNEGFPLWFKRTVEVNPAPTRNDGFFLQIFTQPIAIA